MTPHPHHPQHSGYDLKTYMQPIWQGTTVCNEIVMFFPNGKTGQIDPAPLLYKPERVLSLRSYDLQTLYIEGRDYTVEEGCITLTPHSPIPAWAYDDFYLRAPSANPVGGLPCVSLPGRYYTFGDGSVFGKYQVCVTYTHADSWKGPIPSYQGHRLPITRRKLETKQPLQLVYYGDSVTVGKEASGLLGIAPYMPPWTDMVTQRLQQLTGAKIHAINTSKSGQTSRWGLENIEENVNRHQPDLVVLAFGMNDGSRKFSLDTYRENTENMIRAVRAKHPDCEFLLVATHLPNPDEGSRRGIQAEYAACLQQIAANTCGVAVANVTEVHRYLLTKKRYCDMTGNNVNHPNDWLIRIQGQIIAQALWPQIG